MSKILIISYWFHPFETIGATRVNNFAIHLKQQGWQVKVLSVKASKWAHDGRYSPKGIDVDIDRLNGWSWHVAIRKFSLGIIKSGAQEREVQNVTDKMGLKSSFKKWLMKQYEKFASPDECWPWFVLGRKKALRIAKEFQPDIIFSSAMPFSAHQMALYIKQKLDIPWVADYRDLWVPYDEIRSKSHSKLDKLEKDTISQANCVTSVSPTYVKKLQERFPNIDTLTVFNGFEELRDQKGPFKNRKLKLAYTGIIYPQYQNPRILFETLALSKFQNWQFTYCGPSDKYIQNLVPEALSENIIINGLLSKEEATTIQEESDILVFFTFSVQGWLSGKLLDYLGANKPILAIGPYNKDVSDLLNETKCGAYFAEAQEAADFLNSFASGDGGTFKPSEKRMIYLRKYQAEKLETMLKRIII